MVDISTVQIPVTRLPTITGADCFWGEVYDEIPYEEGGVKYRAFLIKYSQTFKRIYFNSLDEEEKNSGFVSFVNKDVFFIENDLVQRKIFSLYSWNMRFNLLDDITKKLNAIIESQKMQITSQLRLIKKEQIEKKMLSESSGMNSLREDLKQFMERFANELYRRFGRKQEGAS